MAATRKEVNERKVERLADLLKASAPAGRPMPKLRSMSLVNVGPKEAREILDRNDFEFQRPINESRLRELSEKMVDGRFTTATIAIAEHADREILANGQHTLYGIVATGVKIKVSKMVYACESQDEVACLWAQWDTGGGRTLSQMAASYVPVLGAGWSQPAIALLASACAIGAAGLLHRSQSSAGRGEVHLTKEARIDLIRRNLKEATLAKDVAFGIEGDRRMSHVAKAVVAHAVMETARIAYDDAAKFWPRVRDGAGLEVTSPAMALRDHLASIVGGAKINASRKQVEPQRTTLAVCYSAWNAARRNQTVQEMSLTGAGAAPI